MIETKQKFVFLTNEYYPKLGGAATVVHEMANALAGTETDVLVWAPGDDHCPPMPGAQYRVERLGHRGKQDWLARISLLRTLRHREIGENEIWIIAEPGALRAMMYAQVFGVNLPEKMVVILHGSEILKYTAFWHRRVFLKKLLESSAYVHLLSEANANLLKSRIDRLQAPIKVLPGAPSRNRANTRQEQRRDENRIVFMTVGRIHPRKGQLDTLLALSALPESLKKKIIYKIVGPIVRKNYLRKIKETSDSCGFSVEVTGELSDDSLEQAYQQADVFIMTSRQTGYSVEGFGLTYLDASSYGLPIIAYETGGVAEAVRNGETGILVPEGDRKALSQACEELITDQQKREFLGQTGRKFAQSHSWKNSVEPLYSLLETKHSHQKK